MGIGPGAIVCLLVASGVTKPRMGFSHFQAGGRRFRTKSHWELPSHIPNLVHLGGIGPVAIVTPRRIMATLEATQGQISSQSPTDATSSRGQLYGSWLKKPFICPWVASRAGCYP